MLIDELVTGAPPTTERPDRMVCCFGEPALSDRGRTVWVTGNAGRLLAALVARPQGAALDQLIDVVWPGDPPKSARSALHVHLSRLRRELEAVVDGPTVEREGSTYRLDLNGWTVDVDLFRELRRRAATAPATTVAGLLADALRLAQSHAFVVDGESVAPSATYQLAAARLDVEEEFVGALLDLGRFGDAERASIELVDAEPFRERRWALLMRAEAMQGRRRDALATFQRARRRLVDELGLEPGDDLQRTQRFVLSGDTTALQTAEPLPVFEFDREPLPFGTLVGREESVARVEHALAQRVPVIVTGAPGTGKTRLATEIATRGRLQDQEVAWVDLHNMEFRTVWFDSEIERWSRRHPGGLVVIDNAESNVEAAVEAVRGVRRVAIDVGVVVTSRVPLPIDAVVERLGTLGLPDGSSEDAIEGANAVRLLRELLASRAPHAKVEPELAADLVERVSGLPLGIRLVADLARSVPPWQMLDRTASTLRSEIEPAFAAMLSEVTDEARAVLGAISVVPGRLDSGLIGALAGFDGVDSAVQELCEHGLLQFDDHRPDAPYTLLEPLRDVANGLLGEAERVAVLDRLVDECVRRADAMTLLRRNDPRQFPIQEQLARELPWHRQAIDHLSRTRRSEPALLIAAELEMPLYALGWWISNIAVQDAALAIPGDATSLRARVHAARGRPGLLHQLDASHLGLAVDIARSVGDLATEGRALSLLGIKCWWDGAHDDALAHFDAALEVASRTRDRFVEWEARRYAGVTMIVMGRLEEGFTAQLEVLESVRATRGAELLAPHVQMYLG
ncbi:MAG: BTAD domain-containing putative transcriptional regulator, partial [Ilumatobacteraceae bacterium]